jgi:hypothetical protein
MYTAIGRTQVILTDEQVAALRRLAADQGTSVAELVRRAVDRLLASSAGGRAGARRRAVAVVGRFASGRSDVAEEHDRYLAGS